MYEEDFCEYPHIRYRSAEAKIFLMKKCYSVSVSLSDPFTYVFPLFYILVEYAHTLIYFKISFNTYVKFKLNGYNSYKSKPIPLKQVQIYKQTVRMLIK